jgi:membrane-associated phospholipid phosphatase
VSTVFSKQHYILDVLAGMLLASLAYVVVLRGSRRDQVPEVDWLAAPVVAFGAAGIAGAATACLWIAYRLSLS